MFTRYKAMSIYLNLIYKLIYDCNLFVYGEPCGVCRLNRSLFHENFLDINNKILGCLGQVDPESIASFKMVNKLKMSLIEDLYHETTLGPIYFSQIA